MYSPQFREVLGSFAAPVDPPSPSFLPLCSTKTLQKWSPNDQNTLGYFQIFQLFQISLLLS